MATTEEIEGNRIVFSFEDPAGYSAFQIGNDTGDRRHWNRHEESRELQDLVISNPTQSRIVVKYGESYTSIKTR